MSILNDDRRCSDDLDEYLDWLNEVKQEYRRDEYEQEYEDESEEYDE